MAFLQWALPRMRMRWAGFRKVRGQVRKRLSRRIEALSLPGVEAYRSYLESNPAEWHVLGSLCRITISRFYRDKAVFARIGRIVLPGLSRRAQEEVRCWSAGCASGEEAYTIAILWRLGAASGQDTKTLHAPARAAGSEARAAPAAGGKALRVLGTDADPALIERARRAVYPASALKDLPPELARVAFMRLGDEFVLEESFKKGVDFQVQDIRESMPDGPFDMVLCRNLAFTYFDEDLQHDILAGLLERIAPGGVLVVGARERLPGGECGFRSEAAGIYEKVE